MTRRLLVGAPVLVGGRWLTGHGVLVEQGTILAVLPDGEGAGAVRVALPPDALLAAGLVDIQVNGGGGVLFNDMPTAETALAIAAAHRALGTTAILPTLITDSLEAMRDAARAALRAVVPGGPVLGVHFEGPFISLLRPGVHAAAHIRSPGEAELALLEDLARRLAGPVLLTLAPECVADGDLARLAAAGVVLSVGHSAASCERVGEALRHGVTGFTHLFNAMPAISAREPGPAGAALGAAETWCGVIADGVHVHPAVLRLLLAARGPDRVMLVSDAMPPTGTRLDSFRLQGRVVARSAQAGLPSALRTADGTLAGADLCLAEAVRRLVRLTRVPVEQALGMASAVPAAFLGQGHRVGRIAPGCRADLVLLTPGLDVLGTFLGGAWQGDAGVLGAQAA